MTELNELSSPLFSYGTGYVQTQIHKGDDGRFSWVRQSGPDRCWHPLRSHGLKSENPRDPEFATALIVGEPHRATLHYDAPGAVSSLGLLRSGRADITEVVIAAISGTGRALARLHVSEVSALIPSEPPPLARLRNWLASGGNSRGAFELQKLCGKRLGRRNLKMLSAWCSVSSTSQVVLHGSPGVGSLVPSLSGGSASLFVGEDLAHGVPEYDLGWMAGEFLELQLSRDMGNVSAPDLDYAAPLRALARGYGQRVDDVLVAQFAVLRILLHACDYASFVGYTSDLVERVDMVASLLSGSQAAAETLSCDK